MKKIITGVPLLLGIFFSCQQSGIKEVKDSTPAAFNEAIEKEAIMKIIEQETECFYKRDYDGWKDSRAQTDYSYQGWSNPDGTFDVMVGWKAIDEKLKKYITDNPVPEGGTSHPKVVRKNMLFKFYGENVAYMVWDQYNQDSGLKKYYYSKDSRIVEKIEGKWKIVNVTSFWDYKNLVPADSLKL